MKRARLQSLLTAVSLIAVVAASCNVLPAEAWTATTPQLGLVVFGGTGSDRLTDTAVDPAGNIFSVGFFEGTVDFDPSSATFNMSSGGGTDLFITKMSADGTLTWSKRVGAAGTSKENVYNVAIGTDGSVYVMGDYSGTVDFDPGTGVASSTSLSSVSDMFILKLTATGTYVWSKFVGHGPSGGVFPQGGMALSAQGLTVAGTYLSFGPVDFDPGVGTFMLPTSDTNGFVMTLSTAGVFVTAAAMSAAPFDPAVGYSYLGPADLAVDANSNIYMTGYYKGTVDLDPSVNTHTATSTIGESFLLKLTPDMRLTWADTWVADLVSNNRVHFDSVTVDQSGATTIAGSGTGTVDLDPGAGVQTVTFSGGSDAIVVHLAADGSLDWAHLFGSSRADGASDVVVDSSGAVLLTGSFIDTVDFDPSAADASLSSTYWDTFILKLNSHGAFQWVQAITGTDDVFRQSVIALGQNDSMILAGGWNSTADFDPRATSVSKAAAGRTDAFVLRLSSYGDPTAPTTTTTTTTTVPRTTTTTVPRTTTTTVPRTTTTTIPRTTTTTLPRTTTSTSTTLAPSLGAPTNFKATIKDQHILLTASTVRNAMRYTLERDGVQIGTNSRPEFWDIDRSTISGSYTYTMRAMNSAGVAGTAATKSITIIPPAAPPALVSSSVLRRSLTVRASMATDVKTWQLLRNGIVVGAWPASRATVMISQPVGTATYTLAGLSPTGYVKPVGSFSATIAP